MTATGTDQEIILRMVNVDKRFHGVHALKGVSIELRRGEVHAICGENGAGKSTLMKILMGVYAADSGDMQLNGHPVRFQSPRQALDAGIAIIEQELTPIPDMTVAENIFLGREPMTAGGLFVNYRSLNRMAQDVLARIKVRIEPTRKMKTLSVAEVQLVEIAKALSYDSDVLIMDEPTSAIGERETDVLFDIIRTLKTQGKGIFYISHRLKEIFRVADVVTILRDGEYIATKPTSGLDQDALVNLMISRKLEGQYVKENTPTDVPFLTVRNLRRRGKHEAVSLVLHRGEILGIYGLVGAGRSEFLESLFGVARPDGGEVLLEGKPVAHRTPYDSIRNGVAFVTEDRKNSGLALILSVKDNTTLTSIRKYHRGPFVNRRREMRDVLRAIDFFGIKTPSERQLVRNLSGGNQQKVVLGRWLLAQPSILLMDEPTRGIDVGAKREIYKFMSDFANEGNGVIMVSSELPEVIGMSDRILVFKDGRLNGEVSRAEASEELLMQIAT
ncbi:MAG: sugar ABC transporter ATP-binding protein [Planctomycetota bacterium]|jgi:ABC-type sugar transport system ATPase subunit|nr:sugar ABC transporter ATP-binding protein [Planctomycetota bacterium]